MKQPPAKPLRLLVVMPSWLGDCVMATPALRRLRASLPGSFIGGLIRPGMDELFEGGDLFDELHVERAAGIMAKKHAAAKIRPRRYDTALLFTNSFSTALCVRMAGVPRRIGYDRDARGFLLTDRLAPPRRADGSWLPVPAAVYYWRATDALLTGSGPAWPAAAALPAGVFLELPISPRQEDAAAALLARAGVATSDRLVLLNPGGNNPAKRWPVGRYAALADHLFTTRGLRPLVNGSPAELDLCRDLASRCSGTRPVVLPDHAITVGALKGVVKRCSLMVTNDTGPRHIAAAFGVPLVTLFGPTDHRWTTIPTRPGAPEAIVLADPTLPENEVANDHPGRCRIEAIEPERVIAAAESVL